MAAVARARSISVLIRSLCLGVALRAGSLLIADPPGAAKKPVRLAVG